MTITLELEPEIEALLREIAARDGVDATDYARRLIEAGLNKQRMTGAEALAYWKREGVRGVFADALDSPELARQLRDQEEMRSWRTSPKETESSP